MCTLTHVYWNIPWCEWREMFPLVSNNKQSCISNTLLFKVLLFVLMLHTHTVRCSHWMLLSALTGHTLSIRIGLSITGVGVAGGAAVHSTQQGAQVAHRHLLDEGGPIFPEIPPLKYLRERKRERERIFNVIHLWPHRGLFHFSSKRNHVSLLHTLLLN